MELINILYISIFFLPPFVLVLGKLKAHAVVLCGASVGDYLEETGEVGQSPLSSRGQTMGMGNL